MVLAAVLAVAGSISLQFSLAQIDQTAPEPVDPNEPTEQIIVQYKPSSNLRTLDAKLDAVQAVEKDEIPAFRMKVLKVPKSKRDKILSQLNADPLVQAAAPDHKIYALDTKPNDPEYAQQWFWPKVGMETAWDTAKGSSDIVIAVIDSGLNYAHEDLANIAVPGYDFIDNDSDPTFSVNNHGTAVSGILAANSNNGKGVAGGCWNCKIMPLRVLNQSGNGDTSNMIKAINFAIENGADIINMSLGTAAVFEGGQAAIDAAVAKGVPVVAAAGNSSNDRPFYPANYKGVLAVAASDKDDKLTTYSNFGSYIQIAAPGDVYTTGVPNANSYTTIKGTSFSAPLVSSVLAILKAQFPLATVTQLIDSVTKTTVTCCDGKIGGGRINVPAAQEYLKKLDYSTNPPPPTPPPPTPPGSPPKRTDFDKDGKVNIKDLSILLSEWGKTGAQSDVNGDGKVEVGDLSVLLSEWTG